MPLVIGRGKSRKRVYRNPRSLNPEPDVPSLDEIIRQNQQKIQQAIQDAYKQYQPKNIPTFDPAYYMPQNTLDDIRRIQNQTFQPNQEYLQRRAQRQANLLTNPQIEALRKRIQTLKSLMPKTKQRVNQYYQETQQGIRDNASQAITAIIEQIQNRGGLRPGVYQAVNQQVQQNAAQPSNRVEQRRQLVLENLLSQLETQKNNAAQALDMLEDRKSALTEMQYNALVDAAREQFNQARQAQLNILMQIAGMEQSARQTAADLAVNRVLNYNQIMQDLLQQRLQNVQSLQEQLEKQSQEQYIENIQRWQDFLLGSNVQTAEDALRLLRENREDIESSVGIEGFLELQQMIEDLEPGWRNPNYVPPYLPVSGVKNPRQNTTYISPSVANPIISILRASQLAPRMEEITNFTTDNSRTIQDVLDFLLGPLYDQ